MLVRNTHTSLTQCVCSYCTFPGNHSNNCDSLFIILQLTLFAHHQELNMESGRNLAPHLLPFLSRPVAYLSQHLGAPGYLSAHNHTFISVGNSPSHTLPASFHM